MDQERSNRPSRRPSRRMDTYTHRNRQVRIPEGHFAVGLIVGAHGLRGELKVELHTDFPDRFVPGAVLWLGEDLERVEIESARPHQGQMLLQFTHIHDRTRAEAMRGQWLFVPAEEAEVLEEDTYYIHDIVGSSVQTVEGRLLGVVQDILFTGANDVYIVASPDSPPKEILIPAIAQVIQKVDLEQGIIIVDLPPGLVED